MDIHELIESPERIHDIVSANVKRVRKEKNISQLDLGESIGLSGNAYIARAENRVKGHHFNVEHLVKISKVLEVEIGEFFKGL